MSVDHHERIKGVVKTALKEACMGEPFGFSVSPASVWPLVGPQGEQLGPGPAWFVIVTIRGAGLGEGDIVAYFPVPGILPNDADFRTVATGLLERCRQERDKTNLAAFQASGPSMSLKDRPA